MIDFNRNKLGHYWILLCMPAVVSHIFIFSISVNSIRLSRWYHIYSGVASLHTTRSGLIMLYTAGTIWRERYDGLWRLHTSLPSMALLFLRSMEWNQALHQYYRLSGVRQLPLCKSRLLMVTHTHLTLKCFSESFPDLARSVISWEISQGNW